MEPLDEFTELQRLQAKPATEQTTADLVRIMELGVRLHNWKNLQDRAAFIKWRTATLTHLFPDGTGESRLRMLIHRHLGITLEIQGKMTPDENMNATRDALAAEMRSRAVEGRTEPEIVEEPEKMGVHHFTKQALSIREYGKEKGLRGEPLTRFVDRVEKRLAGKNILPTRRGKKAKKGVAGMASEYKRSDLEQDSSGENKNSEQGKQGK